MPNKLVMPTHVPMRLRDDRGFLLVEVLVSAMLLLVASLAIMTALDKSDALAGNQQKRTIAANVAQSELERIRSLPIEDVANLRKGGTGKRTEALNGTTFTVNSDARWLTDGKDTVDCTASNGGLDYLKVTTEVSWSGAGTAKPASMTTIVTPSNRSTSDGNGSLSVSVVDAKNKGIASLPVQLVGSESYSDSTDAQGCVAWGDLDASSPWNLKFSKPGYVDANGNDSIDDNIALAGGTTTVRQYQYDKAGYPQAQFRTRLTASNEILVKAEDLTLANANMTSPKVVQFSPNTSWDGSVSGPTPLFPFDNSPYTVYAGRCPSASPPTPSFLNITGGTSQNAIVYMPSLKVRVFQSNGTTVQAGATVKVTDGCGNTYSAVTTGSDGFITDVDSGFPYFASGSICASYNNRKQVVSAVNTNMNASTVKSVTLPSGANGSC